jgi:hypothetical protein
MFDCSKRTEPRGRERHRWTSREAAVSGSERVKWNLHNGADGISDIEGKVTRVGASERGQRTSFNGADGISDIEHVAIEGMELLGKAT